MKISVAVLAVFLVSVVSRAQAMKCYQCMGVEVGCTDRNLVKIHKPTECSSGQNACRAYTKPDKKTTVRECYSGDLASCNTDTKAMANITHGYCCDSYDGCNTATSVSVSISFTLLIAFLVSKFM
ncbi:uncharacterized protein LOC141912101 [Tubulanus polymorphus]|uniref:uncharacterized protein LOC141912101 n=1 Tax=Tubulanus polymorphus TaxID=672921 RepID=UPI003DA55162